MPHVGGTRHISTKRTLITSFFVDLSDVILNLIVAVITGSAVMLAETLQGTADLSAVFLLLIGYKRAGKASNKLHPFGYGKELYFWTLLSGFIVCVITASLSFYIGLEHFRHPTPISNIQLAYFILIFGVITNSYAFSLSARKILGKRKAKNIRQAFFDSFQIAPKTTFVLDLMGTVAAIFGLTALIIYQLTGNQRFDGIGAMVIGITLAFFGFLLLLGIRDLIIGRSAPEVIESKITKLAMEHKEVQEVLDLKTMIIGNDKILVNIELNLSDELTTNQLEKIIDDIKAKIQETMPSVFHIQIELETPDRELIANNIAQI